MRLALFYLDALLQGRAVSALSWIQVTVRHDGAQLTSQR